MNYILLECEKEKSVAEYEFFSLIWKDQLLAGTSQIVCCGGNTNFEKEFRSLHLTSGDSVYIHYDLLNTFEKRKQGIYTSFLNVIQSARQQVVFNTYILNYMSFEHMILKTSVIEALIKCASQTLAASKKSMYLIECSECLADLYCREDEDAFSVMDVKHLAENFSLLFKDTVVTTREQYISHVCDQLSNLGKRFFHCTKSALGVCWKFECFPDKHQPYCLQDTNFAFTTPICDAGTRLTAILTALGLTERKHLYTPLNFPHKQECSEHIFAGRTSLFS